MATKPFSQAVVSIQEYRGKNSNPAFYLKVVAGCVPSTKQVIDCRIANGMELGQIWLVSFDEVEVSDQYGRQFNVTPLFKIERLADVAQSVKEYGVPTVVNTDKTTIKDTNRSTPATVNAGAQKDDNKDF